MRWTLVLALCFIGAIQSAAFARSPAGEDYVFFESGSAAISPHGDRRLQHFADEKRDRLLENQMVRVSAHTDSAEASVALSQARGEQVRMRLVDLGIPFDRIVVIAHGDRNPLITRLPPGTPEAQNRYVKIYVD